MLHKSPKILFILNPISGTSRKNAIESKVRKILDEKQVEYDICHTQYAGHAIELSKQGAELGYDIVVAIGGDGTVNEVAQGLINTETAMGIIPAGSGNGLARYLKIPFNVAKDLDIICNGTILPIDTLNINGRTAVSIAGIGFDASIAREFAGRKTRGFLPYFQIALEHYLTYQPEEYELVIDDKKIMRQALFISFANSDQFGFNTSIAPDADITDGLMDVTILKKIPMALTPFVASLLFIKQINNSGFTETYKTKTVEICLDKGGRYVNVDGEAIFLEGKVVISVVPRSLKMII